MRVAFIGGTVTEPDPDEALAETVRWLWDNRETLAAG
ncbi:MAG: hypothetical protein QOI91_983 [Solirubrobacteraceae bacterium]|nr:hypothetical protein [Solirubrobacteraceae bacterium]